jgi:hypothetical protein
MKNIIIGLWKPDLKINYYYICKKHPIWEPDDFEKNEKSWYPGQFSLGKTKIIREPIMFS